MKDKKERRNAPLLLETVSKREDRKSKASTPLEITKRKQVGVAIERTYTVGVAIVQKFKKEIHSFGIGA